MKGVVFGLLIVLLVGGVIMFYNRGSIYSPKSTSQIQSTPQDSLSASVKIAAIQFFSDYDKCLKSSQTLVENRDFSSCPEVDKAMTPNFQKTSMVKSENRDPILCSERVPTSYEVRESDVMEDTARVALIEHFENDEKIVTVTFAKKNKAWLVNSIICP